MRRRDLIAGLGGAAVAPLAALAQQPARPLTVGLVLSAVPSSQLTGPEPAFPPARAFVHRIRNLGLIEGHAVTIVIRSAEGHPERAASIIAELIDLGADVMVVIAADWLLDAARSATRTIPTIALFVFDPAEAGRVASLARPGGNLTGVTTTTGREMDEKRLQLLQELAPGVARVGFLGTQPAWETFRRGARADAVPPVAALVDRPEQFEAAFALLRGLRVGGLMISYGPVIYVAAPRIVAFAAEQRLPVVYPWREAVEAGGLMSYGVSLEGEFSQLAGLVEKVLRGAHPADMPVEQPSKFELVINLKTAKALGLTVPPSLLARADEVIE